MVWWRIRGFTVNKKGILKSDFKSGKESYPMEAISLSKDVIDADNEAWTKELTDEELLEIVKQIKPLNAPGRMDPSIFNTISSCRI